MGEQKNACLLKAGIVLGCPWDLPSQTIHLENGFLSSRVYSKAMAQNLKRVIERTMKMYPSVWSKENGHSEFIDLIEMLKKKGSGIRLRDFDEYITSRLGGVQKSLNPKGAFPLEGGANGYYEWASAFKFIDGVKRPLLAINAFDDPIVKGSEFLSQSDWYSTEFEADLANVFDLLSLLVFSVR